MYSLWRRLSWPNYWIKDKNKTKTIIQKQKAITDILNKLVNLLIQLNKLSKEDGLKADNFVSQDDDEIIKRFLSKQNKNDPV